MPCRYQPGDDLRYLDWQYLARIGQPYIRRFAAERSGRLDILIDRSRSMSIGVPSKADVACALAFVFGQVALSAGDGMLGITGGFLASTIVMLDESKAR